MSDLNRDERDDESGDLGGTYVAPSSKVRLPEHVTKLRKRSRRPSASDTGEREA